MVVEKIKIEMSGTKRMHTKVEYTSGDVKAYRLEFSFFSNGERYPVEGCRLIIRGKRPDGIVVTDMGVITDDGLAYYDVKSDMYAVSGCLMMEVALCDAEGGYLTARELLMCVREGYGEAGKEAEDTMPILATLIEQGHQASLAAEAAEKATEEARIAATASLSATEEANRVAETAEQAASAAEEAAAKADVARENAEQATEEAIAAAQEAENSGLVAKKTADNAALDAETRVGNAVATAVAAAQNARDSANEASALVMEAERDLTEFNKQAETAINGVRGAEQTAEQAASAAEEAAAKADVARENAEQATEEAIAAAAEARETAESFSIHSESETGKAYQITDSADGNILGLSLYGESNQNTEITDSKNLCRLETGTWTEGNVTVTYNADTGFFTFKGDNVYPGTMMYIPLADLIPMNSTVGSLTLSIHDVSGTGGQLSIESHSEDQMYFMSSLIYPDNSCATETYAGEDYNLNKLYMCTFGDGAYDYQFRIQIEQGSTANAWQLPNGGYTLTPDTPIDVISVENPTVTVGSQTVTLEGVTLRGLKDSAGNRVARDEIVADAETRTVKLIQRVAVEDVTSNPRFESVGKSGAIQSYTLFTTYNVKKSGILSSILPFYAVEKWQNNMECIYFGDYNIEVNIFLSRLDSALTSEQAILKWVDELVASGVQWLVFYEMKTPIETDITETEAGQALLALHTSYPETALISDGDCMIRYVADTSNAFNKLKDKNVALEERIAALENSIVNQE